MFATFKARILQGRSDLVGKEFNVKIDDCIYFIGGGQSKLIAQDCWNGNTYQARTLDEFYTLERI